MTYTLPSSPPDQLEQLLARAAGRFGRQVRTIAYPDPELAPARSRTVVRMRTRLATDEYVIDPLLVANAIVERVCVEGRTISLHAKAA